METITPHQNLKQQLLERMSQMKASIIEAMGAGPFGTGESRKDFEERIMTTEDAWTNMNSRDRSILPR
jgi:hypothetical protein